MRTERGQTERRSEAGEERTVGIDDAGGAATTDLVTGGH